MSMAKSRGKMFGLPRAVCARMRAARTRMHAMCIRADRRRQYATKKSARITCFTSLLTNGRYTTAELAEYAGVSTDTVLRDLADLQDEPLRLPLMQDDNERWYVMPRPQ